MSKTWRWLGAGLMVLVILCVASTAWLPVVEGKGGPPPGPRFTMMLFRWEPIWDFYATDMNNHGEVMAWGRLWRTATDEVVDLIGEILCDPNISVRLSPEVQAVLEAENSGRDPALPPLKFPSGIGLQFHAGRINDAGQIAAMFQIWNADRSQCLVDSHPFLFTPASGAKGAEFIDLGLPAGKSNGESEAINAFGVVAGDAGSVAVVWTAQAESPPNALIEQPVVGTFVNSYAYDINDSGALAVTAYVNLAQPRAHRYWKDATTGNWTYQDLGVLYARGTPQSMAWGINSLGHVVGDSIANAKGERHAFLYKDRMIDLGTLPNYLNTRALRVNKNDWVVGWASTWSGGGANKRAMLHTGTAMYDLWTLIDNPPNGSVATDIYSNELDINDSGQICGSINLLWPDGVYHQTPFILTLSPKP